MAIPVNTAATTAIDLGTLPASVTQNVFDTATTYTVWYKYTAAAGEEEIGVWGYGGDGSSYAPTCEVYLGPASAPVAYQGPRGGANKPFQMPVTAGVTYYFKIYNGFSTSPSLLTLDVLTAPVLLAPVGSIVVPDDSEDNPAAVLSATLGTVLRFVQGYAAGEQGVALPSGLNLAHDNYTALAEVVLYDAQLIELLRIPTGLIPESGDLVVGSNDVDAFYVANQGFAINAKVRRVSSAGVLGPLIDLGAPGCRSLCVSPDETILYYQRGVVGARNAVKRWDLVNNIALSDLQAEVASHFWLQDMLMLANGRILAGFYQFGSTFIRCFEPDGTVVHEYDLDTLIQISGFDEPADSAVRFAHALDDPASFWVWIHDFANFSHFINVRVSDGVVLSEVMGSEFEGGSYFTDYFPPPLARFGHSFSCPFFILRGAIGTVPIDPPATWRLIGLKLAYQTLKGKQRSDP